MLTAGLVLPPVGHRLILTSHEARFALLARDMRERRVWFDARLRGQPYRNKPPLHPWTIAAAAWWTGRVSEGAARLPSALATVGAALGTYTLAEELFGGRAGLWAALVLATTYGVFGHSQMVLPDPLMVAFGLGAGAAFWRRVAGTGGRAALVGFWAMSGLAVFAKGPAGLLPLVVAGLWLWWERGLAGLRMLVSVWGLLVFTALTLIWMVPFVALGTRQFASQVIGRDWVFYYLGGPRPRAVAEQLGALVVGFLPWTLVLPLAVRHLARQWSHPAVRFVAFWVGVQALLILVSTNQHVRYLLPLYPGLALAVGAWVDAGDESRRRPGLFASKGEYLQIDYYLGRPLASLPALPDVEAFLRRRQAVVVVNQEAWERQARVLTGVEILEARPVGAETLRIIRRQPPG